MHLISPFFDLKSRKWNKQLKLNNHRAVVMYIGLTEFNNNLYGIVSTRQKLYYLIKLQ